MHSRDAVEFASCDYAKCRSPSEKRREWRQAKAKLTTEINQNRTTAIKTGWRRRQTNVIDPADYQRLNRWLNRILIKDFCCFCFKGQVFYLYFVFILKKGKRAGAGWWEFRWRILKIKSDNTSTQHRQFWCVFFRASPDRLQKERWWREGERNGHNNR